MLYHTEEARTSAVDKINRCIEKVSRIPGNIMNYQDVGSIIHFMSMLKGEIKNESKQQVKIFRTYEEDIEIDKKVKSLLFGCGISTRYKGFNILKDAIVMVYEDPDKLLKTTYRLYPDLAKKYRGRNDEGAVSCVVSNMTNAIRKSQAANPNAFAKGMDLPRDCKVTIKMFLSICVKKLREYEEEKSFIA